MVQAALIAPFTTVVLWFFVDAILQLSFADKFLPVRFYFQDLANDFSYATALFLAGAAAGVATAYFVPSFCSTGRWLWLLAVLLLALSAHSFREYARYNSRQTPLLTFLGWAVDLEQWPAYLYLGYSAGMVLWTLRTARRRTQPMDHSALRWVCRLAKLGVAVVGLLAILPIVHLYLRHLDPGAAGPFITAQEMRKNGWADTPYLYFQLQRDVPPGSSLLSVESYLSERGVVYSFDTSSRTLSFVTQQPPNKPNAKSEIGILYLRFDQSFHLKPLEPLARP